ncbi:hypothetical protein A2U01_0017288, partial [Trifolium medium]|nr:hypothetical protein [Trifolium medium]
MKLMSFNLRGWGDSAKRRRLGSLINSCKFDLCMLQETKRSSFEEFSNVNLWGHKDVEWVAKESEETKRSSFEEFSIVNLWGHKDVEWVAKELE